MIGIFGCICRTLYVYIILAYFDLMYDLREKVKQEEQEEEDVTD